MIRIKLLFCRHRTEYVHFGDYCTLILDENIFSVLVWWIFYYVMFHAPLFICKQSTFTVQEGSLHQNLC